MTLLLVYLFAPMYLIVPLMVASVIAADAFAGEKERRTLEALLYTPTTDRELLVGKLLVGFVPALAVAWGGFLLYAGVANAAAWPVMGQIFFPTPCGGCWRCGWHPPSPPSGLGATVLVSARVNTFQEAYQIGGVVVLPIVVLVVGQATGVAGLVDRAGGGARRRVLGGGGRPAGLGRARLPPRRAARAPLTEPPDPYAIRTGEDVALPGGTTHRAAHVHSPPHATGSS